MIAFFILTGILAGLMDVAHHWKKKRRDRIINELSDQVWKN
jgi:hypothetical protein